MTFSNVQPRTRRCPRNAHAATPAGPQGALRQAAIFTTRQLAELEQLRGLLRQMLQLALEAHHLPDPERVAANTEFRLLAGRFQQTASCAYGAIPLFDGATRSVELAPPGNKLVCAGVNLCSDPYLEAAAASLLKPAPAARLIQIALRQLAIGETTVRATLERFHLHLQQPDLCPPPENDENEPGSTELLPDDLRFQPATQ